MNARKVEVGVRFLLPDGHFVNAIMDADEADRIMAGLQDMKDTGKVLVGRHEVTGRWLVDAGKVLGLATFDPALLIATLQREQAQARQQVYGVGGGLRPGSSGVN